jgi:hypothetical protein
MLAVMPLVFFGGASYAASGEKAGDKEAAVKGVSVNRLAA